MSYDRMSHWIVSPGIHRGTLQPSLTTPNPPTDEFTTLDIDSRQNKDRPVLLPHSIVSILCLAWDSNLWSSGSKHDALTNWAIRPFYIINKKIGICWKPTFDIWLWLRGLLLYLTNFIDPTNFSISRFTAVSLL